MTATAGLPGAFVLSLDVELAWGGVHHGTVERERLLAARASFPELLSLLDRHQVRATFAVVGHLRLEGCDGRHTEMPRPAPTGGPDWYHLDPGSDERRDPVWYGASLVRSLRAASPGHDIGAHGFSHLPFDWPGMSPSVAEAEVGACARLLAERGLRGLSFVFPRNRINYTEVLSRQGFACYRGLERRWYQGAPAAIRKAAHMTDQGLGLAPPTGSPVRRGEMVEVPGSMLFLSRQGFRRYLPLASRLRRARKGLAAAAAKGEIFHLWLHAEDLVPDTAAMLGTLGSVLAAVRGLARDGRLVVKTMAELGAP